MTLTGYYTETLHDVPVTVDNGLTARDIMLDKKMPLLDMEVELRAANSTFHGLAGFGNNGASLSGAGDAKEDGFDDILIGSTGANSYMGASSLFNGVWQFGSDDTAVTQNIKQGMSHLGMPAFGESLTDQDIKTIIHYIKTKEKDTTSGAVHHSNLEPWTTR